MQMKARTKWTSPPNVPEHIFYLIEYVFEKHVLFIVIYQTIYFIVSYLIIFPPVRTR